MANNWNPNRPGALGLEWFPVFGATQPIALSASSFVQQLRSTVGETIDSLRLSIAHDPAVTAPFFAIFEVIPTGSEFPVAVGAHSTVSYAPNNDETIGAWTTGPGAMGTVNLWARIDDAVAYPPVGSDYIRLRSSGASAYRATVASAAFPLTARVLRLAVEAVIGLDPEGTDFTNRSVGFSLFHNPTSTVYVMPGNTFTVTAFTPNQVLNMSLGEINPVTLLPWTPADVRLFDTDWHLRVNSSGNVNGGPIVTAMALKVSYIDPENRVALGTWQRPPGALPLTIETDDFVRPDGAGGWTPSWVKPASGDFLFLARWCRDTMVSLGAAPATDLAWLVAYQDLGDLGSPPGISYPPVPGMTADILPVSSVGLPTEAFDGSSRRAARLVLRTSTATDSNDSEPFYVNLSVLESVTSTQTLGQRITPNSSQSYLGVRLVIAPPESIDATLTIRVFGVASGLQIGTGQFTITADEVRALPDLGGGMRFIQGFFNSSVALVSGTQYEVRCSTDAGTWLAIVPDSDGASGPTFAGASGTGAGDCARLNGGTGPSLAGQDMMLVLLIQPTAPATATATVMELELQGGGAMCTPEAIEHIAVQWTATALAGAWARYEVERLEDDGAGVWQPVAVVTSAESMVHFTDWETPRGRLVKYRVRVVANTAAFSTWTETQWVSANATGAEIIFTSNGAADRTVAVDYEPEVDTGFLDHEDDTVVPVYGAPYQLVFVNPQPRGLVKDVRLIVHADNRPCNDYGQPLPDDEVWSPLRAITQAHDIAYVCILDATGDRTYGHVTLSSGRRVADDAGKLQFFWCSAQFLPTQGTPAVVTL